VWESAGNPALDEAAERVALGMEFIGFLSDGKPTCYVTAIPVSFIRR
jgi:hypothetical protein